MERDFLLPDVGEGLEDATIVEWHVHEGATVALNDPLVTIETAKASVELPSPFSGTIVSLGADPGANLRVGELLCRIDTHEPDAHGGETVTTARQETHEETISDEDGTAPPAILVGYGVRDDRTPARSGRAWSRRSRRPGAGVEAPGVEAPGLEAPAAARPLAKPPTRWLARSLGVDLGEVQATGERGEVTREDVRAAAGGTNATPAPAPRAWSAPGAVGSHGSRGDGNLDAPDVEIVPVTGVRARIAERMSRSRATIPDAGCATSADFERLLCVQARIRADVGELDASVLGAFALVAWLVPLALRSSPLLNSTFDMDEGVIRVHRPVHLGIATSTEHGLLVPVLRDAGTRTLVDFAHEFSRLVHGAREGTLLPAELVGSTFTITNYGALGLDDGSPVINAPEAAILGVGAIRPQAVVWDGALAARRTGRLTCAFDHRVCDGSEAARFLVRLKTLVEQPELALATH